jgi:hypothetical protein
MKYAVLTFKLLACWTVGCFLLWTTYGMALEIDQGTIAKTAAQHFVMKMSLIISILIGVSWLWCSQKQKPGTRWMRVLRTGLSTAVFLSLYILIVLVRRNLWSANQGLSDYAQFLPVVGRVNAEFLSGFNWMIFLVEVIPPMSLLSALIFPSDGRKRMG